MDTSTFVCMLRERNSVVDAKRVDNCCEEHVLSDERKEVVSFHVRHGMLKMFCWHLQFFQEHECWVDKVCDHEKTRKHEPDMQFWASRDNNYEHEVQECVKPRYLTHEQLNNMPTVETEQFCCTFWVREFFSNLCLDAQNYNYFPYCVEYSICPVAQV